MPTITLKSRRSGKDLRNHPMLNESPAEKVAKYYVRTGEGTDALGIALDSWVSNGGWQGLSVFRLPGGNGPDEQKLTNERAQALVDAANRGLASAARDAAMRKALEPFAAIAGHRNLERLVASDDMRIALGLMNGNVTQSVIHEGITVEDFRRAAEAFSMPAA